MHLRPQPPPSPFEQQQLRAAEPMWPVWIALGALTISTGGLVAILVGFTGKALHTNGWFWLALMLGTIAGLTALAFQTRSRVTRRMQTALILSLIVHVLMTFVFKESFLAIFSQSGKNSAKAPAKPVPTIPNYYLPSPTGAAVEQAFERPVLTSRAQTESENAVRSDAPSQFEPTYRPTLQESEAAQVVEPTPMEMQRQSQAAPRRTNEMSRLSRQDKSEAKLAAPRRIRAPRQAFKAPSRKQSQSESLEAPSSQPDRRQTEAPQVRRPTRETSESNSQQTAMANAASRQTERARSDDAPRVANPNTARPERNRAESSRIAETQARDLNPANPARSQSRASQASQRSAAQSAQQRIAAQTERAERMSRARPTPSASRPQSTTATPSSNQVAALSRSTASRRSPSQMRPELNTPTASANTQRRSASAARAASSRAANIESPAAAATAANNSSAASSSLESTTAAAAERLSRSSAASGRPSRSRSASSSAASSAGQLAAVRRMEGSRRSSSNLQAGSSTATADGMSRSSSNSSRATTSGSAEQIAGAQAPAAGGPQTNLGDAQPAAGDGQVARQSTGRSGRSARRPGSSNNPSSSSSLAASAATGSATRSTMQRRDNRSQPSAGDVAEATPNTSISRRSSRAGSLRGANANANELDAPQPSPNDNNGGDAEGTADQVAAMDAASGSTPTRRGARASRPSGSRGSQGTPSQSVAADTGARSSNNQPRRASTGDAPSDLYDLADSQPNARTRRAQRRARIDNARSTAAPVESSTSTSESDSDEDSASETLTADNFEPNTGIDRVPSRVRVRNTAPDGSGGLGSQLAATSGIPSRRASSQSRLVHNAPERFLRKSAGGRASVSGKATEINPAFARRTRRRTEPASKGAIGQHAAQVEASIEMGLAYVASVQAADGRWSLQSTAPAGVADPDSRASLRADSAATGLALLSFLGAGYDHLEDRYAENVARGLEFLIANQKPDGDLYVPNGASSKNDGLWFYSHGIAAIALCEAYGMTGDEQLKAPAQKAIDFIVKSQHPERGGWRYDPNRMSDLSVSGWQLMALRSAQLAGLNVPESAIKGTQRLLDAAQAAPNDGSQYCYNPWGNDTEKGRYGPRPNTTMTAVGLMMRLYTGWEKDRPDMQKGADRLAAHLPNMQPPPGFAGTDNPRRDTYYWYSGTIVMYHLQGDHWTKWRDKLYPMLSSTQERDGVLIGSWNPRKPVSDRWAISAGRLYLTTLNLLSLEVHHRHLPLFSDGLELAK